MYGILDELERRAERDRIERERKIFHSWQDTVSVFSLTEKSVVTDKNIQLTVDMLATCHG